MSSFTLTALIENETRKRFKEALLILCSEIRLLCDGGVTIRVDAAPGFISLMNDPMLKTHGITLEIGHIKNINKNPVAERRNKELGAECLHITPDGGPLSRLILSLATANMNSRIRKGGLSAREVWTQRDQITGVQLPVEDRELITQQHQEHLTNHPISAKSKSGGKPPLGTPQLSIGDLVYLTCDSDKTKIRDKYIVTKLSDKKCQVRKFTKHQFRTRAYDVSCSSCYPVMSTTLPVDTGPVRGLDHSDRVRC